MSFKYRTPARGHVHRQWTGLILASSLALSA